MSLCEGGVAEKEEAAKASDSTEDDEIAEQSSEEIADVVSRDKYAVVGKQLEKTLTKLHNDLPSASHHDFARKRGHSQILFLLLSLLLRAGGHHRVNKSV